jgi:hypothetical protein
MMYSIDYDAGAVILLGRVLNKLQLNDQWRISEIEYLLERMYG